MNQLEKIFDKEKVQEKQELANEFAKLGAEKIGDIAREKGWAKNDPRRVILHGLLGGITAKLGGNRVLSGTMAGASVESLQPVLDKFMKNHPDMREEATAILGYATGKLFGGNGDVGAAMAWSGTKFNWLSHEQMDEYSKEMMQAKTEEEQKVVREKWLQINALQGDDWLEAQGNGDFIDLSGENGLLIRMDSSLASNDKFKWRPTDFRTLNEVAIDKSSEVLYSTGLTWGTANWFEANYNLSRGEAEAVGKTLSSATMKTWNQISYIKGVIENHERFTDLKNAVKV